MPSQAFFLENFKKHKEAGLKAFRDGNPEESKYHFLKASEYLFELAKISEGKLKQARTKNAKALLEFAKKTPNIKRGVKQSAESICLQKESENKSDWLLKEKPSIKFSDIAGLDEAKENIRMKMIYPFLHPDKASKYKIRTGGGVLLYGPPGTGKTLLARAIAGELDADFFLVSASNILSKWVGEAEKNITQLFNLARQSEKAVIFLDEIDSLIPKRIESESAIMQRVVPQILSELDGFTSKDAKTPILFVGATNAPWNLDYAILRPGRFDEKIYIGLPNLESRKKILELNLKGVYLNKDVDFNAIAKILDGYSGADISYICRKVCEKLFKESILTLLDRPISKNDFLEIISQIKPSVKEEDLKKFNDFDKSY